jgi:hypothetical protein
MAVQTKQPRRRPQIFNDYDPAAIEAALAKEDWLRCRSRQLMRDLTDAAREMRQRALLRQRPPRRQPVAGL